jgi:type II secretory pathway component PulF
MPSKITLPVYAFVLIIVFASIILLLLIIAIILLYNYKKSERKLRVDIMKFFGPVFHSVLQNIASKNVFKHKF